MWQYFWPHISLIYRNLTGGKTHVCHPVIFLSPDMDTSWSTVYCMGLGLWCLTPLSTLFQLYGDGQFCWWRKPEYPGKTSSNNKTLNARLLARVIAGCHYT
jgi:hypothetical protein